MLRWRSRSSIGVVRSSTTHFLGTANNRCDDSAGDHKWRVNAVAIATSSLFWKVCWLARVDHVCAAAICGEAAGLFNGAVVTLCQSAAHTFEQQGG